MFTPCVHAFVHLRSQLLLKSQLDRPSVTQHERGDYILPMMTRPFSLQGLALRLPSWEEQLLIAEDFIYLLHPQV